jgi:arylsulfatase A-like enzyme
VPANVLLVVFDTARADSLEPYGAPLGSTPVVADLARRGRAYDPVYSTANWTLPSHASMFTGLLPRSLGLGPNAGSSSAVLAAHRDRLLAVVLAARGYDTRGVSANPWIGRGHGFADGFRRFAEVKGGRRHSPRPGVLPGARWIASAVRSRADAGMRWAENVLSNWTDEGPSRPFFWFANLMECHSPYLPPRPYNDLPWWERARAGQDARRFQSASGFIRFCLGELEAPASSLHRMRLLYGRGVRAMDEWLGRVLERLDARRVLDDTLVIVTSDHGENLGEGHLLGHALSLDDRLIRVPLVMSGPGTPDGEAGATSLAALPRLVAEALGITDHPWEREPLPSGIAIAQNDGLESAGLAVAETLAQEWAVPASALERLRTPMACAVDGAMKLVQTGPDERVHDLRHDRLEQRDVAGLHHREAQRLRAALVAADAAARTAASTPVGTLEPTDEVDDLHERLRLLGYL